MDDSRIEIVGAGPAGLAAAITLSRAGKSVVVHEAYGEVGHRFRRDLQGLDNWSTHKDVLAVFVEQGITTDFRKLPCRTGTAFDAWDRAYAIRSNEPLFYMVERGPGSGTLDSALLRQAIAMGVEVRFGSRIRTWQAQGIIATGPQRADVIAVGYHFDTQMQDGFWVICDNHLAPQGYAYLLVMDGKGTVKSCMFNRFKRKAVYVERTVNAFERLVGLQMINPQPHGGAGNLRQPLTAYFGDHLLAGERGGFQDALWGFGMRAAITSGVLAAKSLLDGSDYETRWRQELGGVMKTAWTNRVIFSLLGNIGYRWFLGHVDRKTDIRESLFQHYHPSRKKRLLTPLTNWLGRNSYR